MLATIGGIVDAWSAVPFWDEWDGQVAFLDQIAQGDVAAWWRPHNEHRIVLARALFWLDGALGNGNGVLLLLANLACLATTCSLLLRALRRQLPGEAWTSARRVFTALVWLAMFAWMQRPNLTAGFQVQFFLAQVLPLAAMSALATAPTAARPRRWITLAILLGVLSLGTMANGVFVLPLLGVLALALGLGWRVALALLLLGALGGWLYVDGLATGSAGSERWLAVASTPVALLQFAAAFLGSPAFWTVHGRLWQAELAGVVYLVAFAAMLVRWRRAQGAMTVAMLTVAANAVLAAVAAALGRVHMGLDVACAARYTTAALVGWCALLVAAAPRLAKLADARPQWFVAATSAVALLLFARQFEVARGRDVNFQREVAALALELGARDDAQLRLLYEDPDRLWHVSAPARAADRFCFGLPPLQGLHEALGKPCPSATPVALAAEPTVRALPGDDACRAVECTLAVAATDVWLVDADGTCIGFALGTRRGGQAIAQGYALAAAGPLRAFAAR